MGLTNSRRVSRTAPMKGVKAVSFVPYLPTDLVANTTTGVVALPDYMIDPPAIARYEVRATENNFTETGTFDEATRTIEYVGVNTFFVPGNDLVLRNGFPTLAGLLQVVFIEDYNGKVYVAGSQNGCDVMTIVGGTNQQGFTVTINSKELNPAFELTGAGLADYQEGILAYE